MQILYKKLKRVMMDKILYLVRHGVTQSNKEKIYVGWGKEKLTEEGIV